jgi:hypothetical protein
MRNFSILKENDQVLKYVIQNTCKVRYVLNYVFWCLIMILKDRNM